MADSGAPVDFGGRVLPNPNNIKPVSSEEDTRTGDVPTSDAKFTFGDTGKVSASVQNAPADNDKANGITPHPLQMHFAKKGGPIRRLGSAPRDVIEN